MKTRKAVLWGNLAGAAVLTIAVYALLDGWVPGPKPSFPEGAEVRTASNAQALPPVYQDGIAVQATSIGRGSADFFVYIEDGMVEGATVVVGEAVTLADASIALCDTWVNRWAYVGSPPPGAVLKDPSRAYYVLDTTGSTATCP